MFYPQDGCIVCPTTDSTFDLRTGAIKEWYPKNPVLRGLTPALRTLFVYPVKTDDKNIYISIRGGSISDASAEIVFSGKAQPGITATDVNVDEVTKNNVTVNFAIKNSDLLKEERILDIQLSPLRQWHVLQVRMVVDEDLEGFGFTGTNELINGKAAVIGFLLLLDFELLTGKGLLKGTGFLDFIYSISNAFN
ncbi:rieske (2Fe-2S) domain-containing protein [Actinidia rufa]|uniref:Rieske (2Fe-2S) domain-containing protein n=1 Tax=Actinidia rufa TaxID=165716 RepID=A0A7J0EFX3_9ERIC|nr:rieske (2Fe-2S) domain-containing protein [Actinidia rufa]